jgi:hypothetical protein
LCFTSSIPPPPPTECHVLIEWPLKHWNFIDITARKPLTRPPLKWEKPLRKIKKKCFYIFTVTLKREKKKGSQLYQTTHLNSLSFITCKNGRRVKKRWTSYFHFLESFFVKKSPILLLIVKPNIFLQN